MSDFQMQPGGSSGSLNVVEVGETGVAPLLSTSWVAWTGDCSSTGVVGPTAVESVEVRVIVGDTIELSGDLGGFQTFCVARLFGALGDGREVVDASAGHSTLVRSATGAEGGAGARIDVVVAIFPFGATLGLRTRFGMAFLGVPMGAMATRPFLID